MGFDKLSKAMTETKFGNAIEISALTLEDALKKGAESLKTSIINLDYEVIHKGKKGVFGIGKKDFMVKIWKTGELDLTQIRKASLEKSDETDSSITTIKNGEAKIKIKKAGIYLKIVPPKNGGNKIEMRDAENILYKRGVHNFNKKKVAKLVNDAEDEWTKLGEWIPNPEYDSKLSITISNDEMEATALMSSPIYSGRTLEPEEIINVLESQGVKFGINYDKIKEMADDEITNIAVVVAKGEPPKHGKNAQIVYKFRTGLEDTPLLQSTDKERVDYKNLNRVQNVIAGQIVAEKILAQKGTPGRTVTNRILSANDGKDVPLRVSKNVRLSEDGLKAYAQRDGQVFLSGGDITVREIYEVRGDLDFNVGNIDFVGTVIIHGNVNENFRVKAAGDVNVMGIIYRSEIIADGKITAKGGIKGGKIKTSQSVYSRYIDNAQVTALVDVVAKEEIINSNVSAGGRVICLTGKGGIIGGRVIAGIQINAKKLGSDSYTSTVLEAGIDPNIKIKLEELQKQKTELEKKFDFLLNSMYTLEKEKETKKLTKKKDKVLQKMHIAKEEYSKKLAIIEDKIAKVSLYLNKLENKGTISARYSVYPGVKIIIKNAEYDIKSDYKSVTFRYSGGIIKPDKYQQLDIEKSEEKPVKKTIEKPVKKTEEKKVENTVKK